jgi:hypothetical protein
MKTELLKKWAPAAAMTLFAGMAFAGVSQVPATYGMADGVSQTEPTPEFCKKNPTDPRCDKK